MSSFAYDALESEIPHLRRFARSLVRDHDKADDLVQDALERAIRKQKSFVPGSSLRAWLFTVLRNIHIDQCRKIQRQGRPVEIDDHHTAFAVPAEQTGRVALAECIDTLDQLPKTDRQLLTLVAVEDVSYEAAAEIFGVQTGTVKSRLSRARARLRRHGTAKPASRASHPARLKLAAAR